MTRAIDIYATKAQAKTRAVPASDVPGLPIFSSFGELEVSTSPPWRVLRTQVGTYTEVHSTLGTAGSTDTVYNIMVNGELVWSVSVAALATAQTDGIEIPVVYGDVITIELDSAGVGAADLTIQFEIAGVCATPIPDGGGGGQ